MSQRGCLGLLVGRLLPAGQLSSGLPSLSLARVHPEDRQALTRAQAAAEAAHRRITEGSSDMADIALMDLSAQLVSLLTTLHRLADQAMASRRFLEGNSGERLAREQTDLEMRRLDASAGEILALRAAGEALVTRGRLVEDVKQQLLTLTARIAAAGQEMEAFRARVESRTDAEALGHELTAYLHSAERALEAWDRTRREVEALR